MGVADIPKLPHGPIIPKGVRITWQTGTGNRFFSYATSNHWDYKLLMFLSVSIVRPHSIALILLPLIYSFVLFIIFLFKDISISVEYILHGASIAGHKNRTKIEIKTIIWSFSWRPIRKYCKQINFRNFYFIVSTVITKTCRAENI